MKLHQVTASLILATGLLTGCMSTSSGFKIDSANVSRIQKGVTTRDEIVSMFGQPSSSQMMPDGQRMMTYSYSEASMHATPIAAVPIVGYFAPNTGKGKTRIQMLQIRINSKGLVEDYELSDNSQDIKTDGMFKVKSTPSQTTPK